jgi:hypothetical protein
MKKEGAVVIGPAWDSCGSHQLFKAQIRAFAAMGLETYFLAVVPVLEIAGENGESWWAHYCAMTPDIGASMRGNARFMRVSKYRPALLWGKFAAKRRTQSFWRTMPARLADVPQSLRDFIHSHHIRGVLCNHYFNLPIAEKVRRWAGGVKVVCETQDIQSRHMIDSNPTHPLTGVPGDYESYFRDELRCCEPADEFIHLNQEEYAVFQRELPHKTHHLIYPSLPRPAAAPSAPLEVDFLIVASNNKPNYDSVRWFLDEVWDQDLNAAARLRIVGNLDVKFRADDSGYLTRFGDIFVGRVDDVASWYHRAHAVLAPTIDGQGISIKTIEALSYGRPFIYSPIAVRGFSDYLESHKLPGLCSTASEFKAAIAARIATRADASIREINSDALGVYEGLFAPEVYQEKFQRIFQPRRR